MSYILNNQLIIEDDILLPIEKNGSFWYGDGFFETLKFSNGKIAFADKHWLRIIYSCTILKIQNPFKNIEGFINTVYLLANETGNPVQKIKLIVWRNTYAAYKPTNNKAEFLISSTKLSNIDYPFNTIGIKLGIYTDNLKSTSILGNIKSTSAQLYVLATHYAQYNNYDDVLLKNTNNNIIETSCSNVFIIKNEELYTPPLTEGCLNGIMRGVVLNICETEHIKINETAITIEMLENADEVFITNAIKGIHWVQSINDNIYTTNKKASMLSELLNKIHT